VKVDDRAAVTIKLHKCREDGESYIFDATSSETASSSTTHDV
jgi:hypothetical protein